MSKVEFCAPLDAISLEELYPPNDQRIPSPGNTVFRVDPETGDDLLPVGGWWRSLSKVNSYKLAHGDRVLIAPGKHTASLQPSGHGSADSPVVIEFLPGTHVFAAARAIRLPMYVSNSCDDPTTPKPICILMQEVSHFQIEGGGVDGKERTTILCADRMVQVFNDRAQHISFRQLVFDLQRPTVSEFRVLQAEGNRVLVQVAEGSDYTVDDGHFYWRGDIGSGVDLCQEYDPETGRCQRRHTGAPWDEAVAEDLGNRLVQFTYSSSTGGLHEGLHIHHRKIKRDSVGVHNARSRHIAFEDCVFHALTNMGFVSQFTEHIRYQRVHVVPPSAGLRTCPAWGDIFHFSNCKGSVLVDSCELSGMQDDAINCHGTHLRIISQVAEHRFRLRFMQPQTFGFAPFTSGDEVAVIQHSTLREYENNPRRRVVEVIRISAHDWDILLDKPCPYFEENDVVDNLTWYPDFHATNNRVSVDPVRGFLVTTRGQVVIENNTFHHCAMAGLLIEDDAEGWFESGPVRDMIVRDNRFIKCGIEINPQTRSTSATEPVHENIRIENNYFESAGISARSVRGLLIRGNRSTRGPLRDLDIHPSCSEVECPDEPPPEMP